MKGSVREPRFQQGQLMPDDITADDQVLLMNNERFSVPELLFNPQDVGLDSCGVADAVASAISECPAALQPFLWSNILCVGGNACLPNFRERLEHELRAIAPEHCEVRVVCPASPVKAAWAGGCAMAKDNSTLTSHSVSVKAYKEAGRNAWARAGHSLL